MSWSRRSFVTGLTALAAGGWLSGCGYRPLYGSSTTGADLPITEFQYIRITPIAERVGQATYNFLSNRLNPRGRPARPRYVLNTTVTQTIQYTLSSSDETYSRANLNLLAVFTLNEAGTGTRLYRSSARAQASFDVLVSQYATDVAASNAASRAAELLSDDIVQRLGLYFSRIRTSPTAPATP